MADLERLKKEQESFDAQLPELLEEHAGEFALFCDHRVVEFFADHESAYAAGLDRFGPDGTFLIAEVAENVPRPVSFAWDAGVMFGER